MYASRDLGGSTRALGGRWVRLGRYAVYQGWKPARPCRESTATAGSRQVRICRDSSDCLGRWKEEGEAAAALGAVDPEQIHPVAGGAVDSGPTVLAKRGPLE